MELIFNSNQVFVGIDVDVDEDEQRITYAQLPSPAQSFLQTYFPTARVVLIKQETEARETTYKVYTHNGFNIELNQQGVWIEIETKQDQDIPTSLMPASLTRYIQTHYSDFKLRGIEKKSYGFEVELTKGRQKVELLFDYEGNFIRIDA